MDKKSAKMPVATVSSRALTPAFTGSLGNLEAYIAEVNRLPILTQEQENLLAKNYQENNDLAAAQQLIMAHLRLVVSVARSYLG